MFKRRFRGPEMKVNSHHPNFPCRPIPSTSLRQNMHKNNQNRLTSLTTEHKSKLEELRTLHTKEVEELHGSHARELGDLRQQLEAVSSGGQAGEELQKQLEVCLLEPLVFVENVLASEARAFCRPQS